MSYLNNQHTYATLKFKDQEFQLDVKHGTLGYPAIDIKSLQQNGLFTYDPGYLSTASCSSSITFIDGDQGILLHRGYSIESLCENNDFMDMAYLLLNADLPSAEKKLSFEQEITDHTLLHEQVIKFYQGFRRDAHPMAILLGVVGALSAFYHDSLDIHDEKQRMLACLRMIAKMPTIAAYAYRYSIGLPFVYPRNSLNYSSNFLYLLFGLPTQEYQVNPVLSKALDQILLLHADHEQNASTSTVRIVGSSGANPFACIAAGVASLWGPAHGGANEAVIRMLEQIQDVSQINEFIRKAKDKDDPFRLMGFGHRIYKNYDPRAKIMRKLCHEVLDTLGDKDNKLLNIAMALEKIALNDEYFIEKKLYPNVDFYSGIVFHALGIPINMYTAIFAVARTVGWSAQWLEMSKDPEFKISRPRQVYTGPAHR